MIENHSPIDADVGCKDAIEAALKAVRAARVHASKSNNPSIHAALRRSEVSLLESRGESAAHHQRLMAKVKRKDADHG